MATSGIAGVTVVAEDRGRGLLDGLFDALLKDARERGVAISTLFPTAPRIYRRFGYEVVGQFDTVELRLPSLAAGAGRPGTSRTRRALPADLDAVRDVYDAWAAAQNGPLTRRGPSFPATAEEMVAVVHRRHAGGRREDRVHGYAVVAARPGVRRARGATGGATWSRPARTPGRPCCGPSALRVGGAGHPADTSGDDPVRYLLPGGLARRRIRALHAAAARPRRRVRAADLAGAGRRSSGPTSCADENLTHLDGGWRLRVADGATTCERGDAEPGRRSPAAGPRAGLGRDAVLREPADGAATWPAPASTTGAGRAARRRAGARPR